LIKEFLMKIDIFQILAIISLFILLAISECRSENVKEQCEKHIKQKRNDLCIAVVMRDL